jgi:hypothetical protein
MARDPAKTARNREILRLKDELAAMLPTVLEETGIESVHVLHGKLGSKHDQFMDIRHDVIRTPEEFQSRYFEGFMRYFQKWPSARRPESAYYELFRLIKDNARFREYTMLFLERTFLKHFDFLCKERPKGEDAELWIGQKNVDFGLLVSPRFNGDDWENDKSEIRKFRPGYFTVGHVLETGLVIPGQPEIQEFDDVESLLKFFRTVLVRSAGSTHQSELAKRYSEFVLTSADPLKVPFLIPELRYKGRDKKHIHRLDFCAIDPFSLRKVGFELSPFSSHAEIRGIKGRTQIDVNREIKKNFEAEAEKSRNYFLRWGITVLVFTDKQLADPDGIFAEVEKYLKPERAQAQLLLQSQRQFMSFEP